MDEVLIDVVEDMARDLLELVVEGPENDSIYAVYQEPDQRSDTDDEEIEARRLDANNL